MCFNISPCLYCLQAGLEKGFQNPDSSQSFSLGFNIQYSIFKIQNSIFQISQASHSRPDRPPQRRERVGEANLLTPYILKE